MPLPLHILIEFYARVIKKHKNKHSTAEANANPPFKKIRSSEMVNEKRQIPQLLPRSRLLRTVVVEHALKMSQVINVAVEKRNTRARLCLKRRRSLKVTRDREETACFANFLKFKHGDGIGARFLTHQLFALFSVNSLAWCVSREEQSFCGANEVRKGAYLGRISTSRLHNAGAVKIITKRHLIK
jgi:hypothetical protein